MMLHIIADDLTGACDTGAVFAQRGLSTAVVMNRTDQICPTPHVLVQTTESRHLSDLEATFAAVDAARNITSANAWVYKKIDSTLRGHPGSELAALMDVLGISHALVAPAFPAQGRTVLDGHLYVHGVPLEQTAFAAEGVTSDVRAFMAQSQRPTRVLTLADVRAGTDHLRAILQRQQPCIFVADAETDSDLDVLVPAAAAAGIHMLCGSAGLATALATYLAPAFTPAPPASHQDGPVLVVAGSRNPVTARQVENARQAGVICIELPIEFIHEEDPATIAHVAQSVVTYLAKHDHALLSTCDLPESPHGRRTIAQRLGKVVALVADQVKLGGLVLTGGDVAAATCAALEVHLLWLHGETQPGIALGHVVLRNGGQLPIITKAGGFGNEDALLNAISNLY